MNNDLISRKDLQIEITKQIAYFHDRANTTSIYDDKLAYNLKATGLELARVLIDNASTVEPFERNGKTYHKCNHCHISSELILIDNFCPHCGASMRKGGAE